MLVLEKLRQYAGASRVALVLTEAPSASLVPLQPVVSSAVAANSAQQTRSDTVCLHRFICIVFSPY